jgi:hypothetical protein
MASETDKHVFDILIATNPRDTKVMIDDKDITHTIRKIEIIADPGVLPVVRLEIVGIYARTQLHGDAILEILHPKELKPKSKTPEQDWEDTIG